MYQNPLIERTARLACGSLTLRLFTPLLLLVLSATWAPELSAEGCEGCPAPSSADVVAHAGLKLETRFNGISHARDRVEMDKGPCTGTMSAPPEITRLRSWLVLRAMGEVFNCPAVKSSTSVTAETRQADSSSWSLTVTGTFKLKSLAAEVSAEISKGHTTGVTITEVTRITTTLTAGHCRRVPWKAYFEVGEFQAKAEFAFVQHWAWWTKNATTGAKVHAKGTMDVACGSSEVTMARKAPVAGYFELGQRSCPDPECTPRPYVDLGFFPPLPPHLPNPGGTMPGEPENGDTRSEEDGADPALKDGGSPETEEEEPQPDPDPTGDGEEPSELPSSDELGDAPTGRFGEPSTAGDGETSEPQPSSGEFGDAPTGSATDPHQE